MYVHTRHVKVPIHTRTWGVERFFFLFSLHTFSTYTGVDARNLCCCSLLYSCSELLKHPKDQRISFNLIYFVTAYYFLVMAYRFLACGQSADNLNCNFYLLLIILLYLEESKLDLKRRSFEIINLLTLLCETVLIIIYKCIRMNLNIWYYNHLARDILHVLQALQYWLDQDEPKANWPTLCC